MGTRGRVSAAALAIAPPSDAVRRLSPPAELTDEEMEIWVRIVNTESADKFAPSHIPLLAAICRHEVKARRCAEFERRLDADKNTTLQDYKDLWQMAARETSALATLATKLCLSPKSTTNHRGNKKPIPAQVPWDDADEG